MQQAASVSFCISTYKRPDFLRKQLESLSHQVYTDFEIVISDNDPEASAKEIVESFNDARFGYFHNGDNLGMIKSFNKSIERAQTEYIVMVTDDDPIQADFLSSIFELVRQYPGYSVYAGFSRVHVQSGQVEIIEAKDFPNEILDKSKTDNILWSSCMLRRDCALEIGMIPDYGSPHLADDAFLVKAGGKAGAVIINRMYSSMSSHGGNYSKFNFEAYLAGCKGFYAELTEFFRDNSHREEYEKTIIKHLGAWFITSMFNLKRYYTVHYDCGILQTVDKCSREILHLPYMRGYGWRFRTKSVIFILKRRLGLLK